MSRNRFLIVIVLVLLASAGLLSWWLAGAEQRMYENTYGSAYTYRINIHADGNLSNVTFYLPIPVKDNSSPIADDIIQNKFNTIDPAWGGDIFVNEIKDTSNYHIIKDDPPWDYSLVYTEHGPMLSIKAKTITLRYPSSIVIPDGNSTPENRFAVSGEFPDPYLEPLSVYLCARVPSESSINTRYPIGNETVLLPKYDLNIAPPDEYLLRNKQGVLYDSRMYAHYDSGNDTRVNISIKFDASNSWWTGGSQSNSFHDELSSHLIGPQDTWVIANGTLVSGDGVYRHEV